MRHRVVLVRGPRAAGGGGVGCCIGEVRPFDEGGDGHRQHGPDDEIGPVYRALRAALPDDVDIEVVSPSNWPFLLPELVHGARRRGLHGRELRHAVRRGLAVSSLLLDGSALSSGGLPPSQEAVDVVRAELSPR